MDIEDFKNRLVKKRDKLYELNLNDSNTVTLAENKMFEIFSIFKENVDTFRSIFPIEDLDQNYVSFWVSTNSFNILLKENFILNQSGEILIYRFPDITNNKVLTVGSKPLASYRDSTLYKKADTSKKDFINIAKEICDIDVERFKNELQDFLLKFVWKS